MNFLELWGVGKIEHYYRAFKDRHTFDSIEQLYRSKALYLATFIAFIIGALLTLPIIFLELEWHVFNVEQLDLSHIVIYAIILITLILLEFYLLFLLSFYMLAYYFHHLYHIVDDQKSLQENAFLAMMSRTVMELSEDHEQKFNIDHKELSNREIAILALLYKVKVVLTNFLLKFVAKKALSRTALRLYTPYVAALGTGIWDAFVFYKVMRDAQYKIMVRYSILYLLEKKMNLLVKEANTKAILSRYYHYAEYNNNLDYLLKQLHQADPFDYDKSDFLEEDVYRRCHQSLLLLLFSFKESFHSFNERKIIKSINQKEKIQALRRALQTGDYPYVKAYIDNM